MVKIKEKGSPAKTEKQVNKLVIRNLVKNPNDGDKGKNDG